MLFKERHVVLLCIGVCAAMTTFAQTEQSERSFALVSLPMKYDSSSTEDTTAGLSARKKVVDDDALPFSNAQSIVVSASRWEEQARTVSREITTVSARQVQLRNPATTADMLGQTGRVFVQKSQLGGGSPMLRGFGANSVLLVIDGVRMNNAIYRGGNLQNSITIDANALDGAEVLYGPGSVQYGSDALGGVMVFRTRQAVFADDSTLFNGTALLRYGTAAQEKTATAAIDLGGTHVASATVLSVTDFDDLRGGSVFNSRYPDYGRKTWYVERKGNTDVMVSNPNPLVQVSTGYSQINLTENLAVKVAEGLTLNYGGIFTTSSNVPRYDRLQVLSDSLPRSAEWYYGPQTWTMHTLSATIDNAGMLGKSAKVSASFQYYNESRNDRGFNKSSRRKQDETVLIGSVNADIRADLDNSSTLERDLYYGIEAFVNDVSSVATRTDIVTGAVTPTGSRYPDGSNLITSGAAYIQTRWATSTDVIVAAGARYTIYDLQSSIKDTTQFPYPFTDLSMSTTAMTGSLGATWLVCPAVTLHSNISSGFRAPNLDDIAKVFESGPGVLIIPNAKLGPEYVYTVEGGFRWMPTSWLSFEGNAFRSWGVDAIQRQPAKLGGLDTVVIDGAAYGVFANTNIGQSNIHGISTQLDAQWKNFAFTGTGVYQNGTVAGTTLPLSHMPPAYGSLRLAWKEIDYDAGISFWWNAAKPRNEIPTDGEAIIGVNSTPDGSLAWQRVDLAFGWRIHRLLEVRGILENLLDQQYRPYASGVSAPGRNFVVSVRGTW